MPRKEFSIRVTDPGASGMALRVKQIQTLLADLKKEGFRVLSSVKDPNGLNLELVGTAGVTRCRSPALSRHRPAVTEAARSNGKEQARAPLPADESPL